MKTFHLQIQTALPAARLHLTLPFLSAPPCQDGAPRVAQDGWPRAASPTPTGMRGCVPRSQVESPLPGATQSLALKSATPQHGLPRAVAIGPDRWELRKGTWALSTIVYAAPSPRWPPDVKKKRSPERPSALRSCRPSPSTGCQGGILSLTVTTPHTVTQVPD